MVDRVNEDTRNATAAQEGQEASTTETLDSGSQPLSESVAQLAQNEPENTGDTEGDTGTGDTAGAAPDNPQELISQALAVLAEQGFDVEDGIDLQDPAVVAALQDAGIDIDQLVLAVAEVTGEQIEPAAGPEAGPGAVAAGGGDRFSPTDPGSIDDGIGISGLLGPRDVAFNPLEVEPTGSFGGVDLGVSVAVQTDIDGLVGLGLFEDWQSIQAQSQDPGGSSGFSDSDTDFDTEMYQSLRDNPDYTPFDSLGNPEEDFVFPGNLVFDITAEPDTVEVDYGPLTISGAPAGSYLFYVDGGSIERFDFVDGTETFTLGDVSEAYLEGNNIFILPPEDSDVDFTLNVSLDAEAQGETITISGDVPVILDAVADLPEIEAGSEGSNFDGDTFYFDEDHSLEGGEGNYPSEGGEGYYPPVFGPEGPQVLQREFDGDFPREFPGQDGPCYQGWTHSYEPTYGLPFTTAITDRDLAIGRDEPSEGLIRVTLGLSEHPDNNTEVASGLPQFGQYDEESGQNFYASIGDQRLDSESLSEGGLEVTLLGQYWSEATGLQSGEIQATATLDENGQLVFTNFQVEGEGGAPLEGLRVQEINFSNFEVTLPQHADNDLQFNVASTSRELRADNLPAGDEELTFDNNEATSQETYNVEIRAVADGAKISVTLESYREIEGNCGAHGVCEWGNGDIPQAAFVEAPGYYSESPYSIAFTEDGEKLSEAHGKDSTETPLQIPMHFTASLIDEDGSESVTQFTISLDGAADGTHFVDADGNALSDGQTITIDGVEGTVSLDDSGNLAVDFGENAVPGQNLDVTGEIGIELPIDSSKDFRADISVTTTETDPTNPDAVALSSKTTQTSIDFGIGGVAGSAAAGFGDYAEAGGLCRIAEDGSVVLVEDGESSSSEHGANNSESALVIPVKYSATTQDSDGSEGITEIVLDKGASDGVWVDQSNGDPIGSTIVIEGATWNVSENEEGQLVLSYEEAENGNQAGPESVDLSGVVGIELPIDDSTDFTLTGQAKTQEYDDDAFVEGGEGRELVDGWEEVNDCGDKQAWNEPSSVDFKLSGVAGPAKTGFDGYGEGDDGICSMVCGDPVTVGGGEEGQTPSSQAIRDSWFSGNGGIVLSAKQIGSEDFVADESLFQAGSNALGGYGLGVVGGTRGVETQGPTDAQGEGDYEAIRIDFDQPAGSAELTLSRFYEGEEATVRFFDAEGNLLGEEIATGDGNFQSGDGPGNATVSYDCNLNGNGPLSYIEIEPSSPGDGNQLSDFALQSVTYQSFEGYSFVEDGEKSSSEHGFDGDESNLVIPLKYTAETQDADGSEGITQVQVAAPFQNGEGAYENWQITQGGETKLFSEWQAEAGGEDVIVTLTDQGEDGKDYDFVVTQGEDGSLTLTLHADSVPGPESINLDGVVDLQVPIDDSTDFTFEVDTTTFEFDDDAFSDLANRELDPEAEVPDYCGEKSETVSDSLPIKVEGVAGSAEVGFGVDPDACKVVCGDEQSFGLTEAENPSFNAIKDAWGFGETDRGFTLMARTSASGEFVDDESLFGGGSNGQGGYGLGVIGDGTRPVETEGGINTEGTNEAIRVDFDDPVGSFEVTLSRFYENEGASITIYDVNGNQITVDKDTDLEGVGNFQQDENAPGDVTFTLDCNEVKGLGPISHIDIEPGSPGDGNDRSDFALKSLSFSKVESIVMVEDGEASSSAHGDDDSESALVVDVNYQAATQDGDGSEGITKIELSHDGDGTFVNKGDGNSTFTQGSSVTIEGVIWTVTTAEDNSLVLDFAGYEGEEGEFAAPTSVNLSDVLGVKLPIDDSTDFDVEAITTTQEYDDDAFADVESRELVEQWEAICGDDTATSTDSIHVKVSGVAGPAEGGFDGYEGDCKPVYEAGEGDSVPVDLRSSDGRDSVTLKAYTSGESFLDADGKLDTSAGSESAVKIASRGLGVTTSGEDDEATPDQINHNPDGDATEGLLVGLGSVTDTATVKISNLFQSELNIEGADEYGRVTLFNESGDEVGSYVFGLERPESVAEEDFIQVQNYNSSQGVGTIDIPVQEGCFFSNMVFTSEPYLNLDEGSLTQDQMDRLEGASSDYFVRDVEYTPAEQVGYSFVEDGEASSSEHGPNDSESARIIDVKYSATTQDSDGSEGVTEIVLDKGESDGSWVDMSSGSAVALNDGGTIVIDGATWGVAIDEDGVLTLSYDEAENGNIAGPETVDLSGVVGIELPIDDSTDFTLTGQAKTQEYDDDGFAEDGADRELIEGWEECNDCGEKTTWNEPSSVDFKLAGVAGPAEGGFGEYEGDCAPVYGAGEETVSADLSGSDAPSSGVSLYGFGFGSAFAASGMLDLSGAAAGSVTFDPNGAGVLVGSEDRGLEVPDQVGHDPETGESEALVATLDDPASLVTVTVSNQFNNEAEGEYGQVTLFNPAGEEIGTVLFGSSADAPEDYEGIYQQVDFGGSSNVGTLTLNAQDLCEGDAIGALAFEAAPYGGSAENNGAGDSSDYFVREIDYTKAEQVGYTLVEDGEASSSEHGPNDSESARIIDVKYSATTQDSDGSEGVTEIVLNKGESDGVWVDQSSGDPIGSTIVIDGKTWNVTQDGSQLTLSYDEAENGNIAGPETVDLSGVVGIELPIDDSTDFTLTGQAKTQEYDDDGFAEDGADRELIEGWEECNDCGEKTAWNEPSSVDFKVSGVAGAAVTSFADYAGAEGFCDEEGTGFTIGAGTEKIIEHFLVEDISSAEEPLPVTRSDFRASEEGDLGSIKIFGGETFYNSQDNDGIDAYSLELRDGETLNIEGDGGALFGEVNLFLRDAEGNEIELTSQDGVYSHTVEGDGTYDLLVKQDGHFSLGMVYGGKVTIEPSETPTYIFSEDAEAISDLHGDDDSESPLVIPVKYSADTQDSDGSEGITEIVLDKGESDGAWTAADGSSLGSTIQIDDLTWNVSENDDGQLVLTYDEAANDNQAGPESVDLSGVIGVNLPVDDSTDFALSGKAKTQEYDDDAFTGEGRELIENWEECNDCGDKNEWSGWDSVNIRVDGVAGPAATTNIGYEEGENGFCGLEPTGFGSHPQPVIEIFSDKSSSDSPHIIDRSDLSAPDDDSAGSIYIAGGETNNGAFYDAIVGADDGVDLYSIELREGESVEIDGWALSTDFDLFVKSPDGTKTELEADDDGIIRFPANEDGSYNISIEVPQPDGAFDVNSVFYGGTLTVNPSETPTYVFSEDAGEQDLTDAPQEQLNIPVNYTAQTQDSDDGSEGITRVSLSLGAAIAGMSWTKDGNALEDGDTVMLTDQENSQEFEATVSVNGDGSELTLNIPAPGIQNLDLSADELGIELPKDYSGEFSLNVDTTTTEFDDDFMVIDEETGERSLSEGNGEFDPECAEDTHTVSDSVNYKVSAEADPAKTGWKGDEAFGEDGGEIGADCQDPNAEALTIPAHLFAKVQDVDGSESITGLKLSFDTEEDGGSSFQFLQDGEYVSYGNAEQPLLIEAVGKTNGNWGSITLKVTSEGDGFLFTPVNADGTEFEGQSGIELVKFPDGDDAPVLFSLPQHFNGDVNVNGAVQTTEYGPIYEGCEDCEPKDSRWTEFDKTLTVEAINDKPMVNDVDSESECAVPEGYMNAFNGDGVPSAEDVIAFKAFDVTDFGSQDGLEENGSELGGWDVEGDDLTYTICEQPEYGALYKWDGESLTKLENGDSFTSEDEVIWGATAEDTAVSHNFDSADSMNGVPLKGYSYDGEELTTEDLAYKNDATYGDGVGVGSPVRDAETSTDGERVEKVVFGGQEGKLYSGATVSMALLFAGEGGGYEADGNSDTDESMEWFAIRDGEVVEQGAVDGTQDGNASFTVNTAFDSLLMKPVDNGQGSSGTNSDFVISDIEAQEVPQDAGFTYCVSDGECTVEGNVTVGVDTKPFADDVQAESVCHIPEDVQTLFSESEESDALDGAVSFKEFSVDSLVGDHDDGGDSSLGGFDYQTAGEDLTFKLEGQPDFGTLYRFDGEEMTEMQVGDTFSIGDRIFWVAKEEDAVSESYGISDDDASTTTQDWIDSFEKNGATLEGFEDGDSVALDSKYNNTVEYGGIGVGGTRDAETDWKEGSVEKLVFTPGQKVLGASVELGLFFGNSSDSPYENDPAEVMQWIAKDGEGNITGQGTVEGTPSGQQTLNIDVPFESLELIPQDNGAEGGNLSDFVLRGIETQEIPQETGFDYGVYDDPDCENCVDTGTVTIDVGAQPIANDDTSELAVDCEDSTPKAEGNLLANDYDEDGSLTVSSIDGQEVPSEGYKEIEGDYGTLKVWADGSYEYQYEGQTSSADLSSGGNLDGASLHGYDFGETYLTEDGKLDTGNLADDGSVTRTSNGAGVSGALGSLPVPDQINHDPNGEGSQAMIVDLGNSSSKATVGLSNLFNDENEGEYGLVKAYDGQGNLVGTAVFGQDDPNIDGVNFIGVDFNNNNQGTIDLDCGSFCGGKPFQYLAFEGVEYGADLGEGGEVPTDSSDYFISSIDSTEAVPEDGLQENFEYSVKDGEGCETTANLTIDISSDDEGTPYCEVCNTPPQADNVNSTAVLLSEYEDGDLDSAMDEFNLEEGDYTFVREFSVNNIVGEDGDGESEDTSLGGYDLETPLGSLGFQITEAPQSGTLLIKDGDSYTKIDAGTDPNDLPSGTFSSNAKVWWLGDAEGETSETTTVSLGDIGNGNLNTTETSITDPNLGNVTFTSLISNGSGGFQEGGSLFHTGNGLGVKQQGVGGPSNNQIDEDERLGVTFENAVDSATFTAKPYNGEPDGDVAWTTFDENGNELDSGTVTITEQSGSTATFTVMPGQSFHSIQIGPDGNNGANEGANFSIQSIAVEREGASFLQDTFKYEVIDDCEETSDEATVIIGAEGGGEITLGDPEDGVVDEQYLSDGSANSGLTILATDSTDHNGGLNIDWIDGPLGGDKSLTFSADQPSGLDGLTSNGDDVEIVISGDGKTLKGVVDPDGDAREVFEVTLDEDGSGSYDFELKDNLDHPYGNDGRDELDLEFNFDAGQEHGEPQSGSFQVTVEDDIPSAEGDTATANKGLPDPVNLTLVLDRSGSMEGNRLNEMKSAAINLIGAFVAAGAPLKLNIIGFNSEAQTLYDGTDISDAESIINAMTANGGTNFENALEKAQQEISADQSNPAFEDYGQKVYFLSDADEDWGSTDLAVSGDWQNFVSEHGLDVTAVGIEGNISEEKLEEVSGDPDKVIKIDDIEDLEAELLATIGGDPVSGNLLSDSPADISGADGVQVNQVQFDGIWHGFEVGEETLEIETGNGVLVVAKDGSYTFTPNSDAEAGSESFLYEIIDGDGDTARANLDITIQAPQPVAYDNQNSVGQSSESTQTLYEWDFKHNLDGWNHKGDAYEWDHEAWMSSDHGSKDAKDIEGFLGLGNNSLTQTLRDHLGESSKNKAEEGSAIKKTIQAEAGDKVSFDWTFKSQESSESDYDDFGVFTISGNGNSEIVVLSSADSGSHDSGTYTFEIPDGWSGGEYTLGFAAMDDWDASDDFWSSLSIDNVTVTGDRLTAEEVTGNVIEDPDHVPYGDEDYGKQDTPANGTITGVVHGSQTFEANDFDQNGWLEFQTDLGGTLNIHESGDYTYSAPSGLSEDQTETFTYTLDAGNGQTAEADLTINVSADGPDAYNNAAVVGQSGESLQTVYEWNFQDDLEDWDGKGRAYENDGDAIVSSYSGAQDADQIENFLELGSNSLTDALDSYLGNSDYNNATEGSAIRNKVQIQGGDTITFDWTFGSNESSSSEYDDFGVFTISGNGESEVIVLSSANDGSSATGSHTFEVPNGWSSGEYTIGFAAMDDYDTNDTYSSYLSIDNIKVVGNRPTTEQVSGNVIEDPNDDPEDVANFGKEDSPSNGTITEIHYGSDAYDETDFDSDGSLRIDSSLGDGNGYLDIWTNGHYEYTAPSGLSADESETFTYTLSDGNGETATADLTIDVRQDSSVNSDDYQGGFKSVDTSGSGDETFYGEAGENNLIDASDRDHWEDVELVGRDGNDVLIGGKGDDELFGGGGKDVLNGGAGKNTLDGGDDADTFVFDDAALADLLTNGDGNADTINNFDVGEDSIDLSALSDVLYDQENLIGNVHMDDNGELTVDVRNEEGNKETVKVAEVTDSGGGGVSDAQVYVDDNNSENIA